MNVKTITMVVSKNEDMQVKIKINEKQLEEVQHFKYLGQMSRDISLDFRLSAINLYVYSILHYSDETWTL